VIWPATRKSGRKAWIGNRLGHHTKLMQAAQGRQGVEFTRVPIERMVAGVMITS